MGGMQRGRKEWREEGRNAERKEGMETERMEWREEGMNKGRNE